MPVYSYLCPSCGLEHTLVRPVAECKLPASCPDCGTSSPRRLDWQGPLTVGYPTQGLPGLHKGVHRTVADQFRLDWAKEQEYKKKFSGTERAKERLAKEADQREFAKKGPKPRIVVP